MIDDPVLDQTLDNMWDRIKSLEAQLGEMRTHEPVVIAARAQTAAGPTMVNGAATIIDFATKTFDPRNLITTGASWKFTAPIGGIYVVSVWILLAQTTGWVDTESAYIRLHKNGAIGATLFYDDHHASASNVYYGLGGADLVQMAAGDYIDVRCVQNSGANLALHTDANQNYIAIWKL